MQAGEGCCAFDWQWTGPGIGATDLIYLFCGSVEAKPIVDGRILLTTWDVKNLVKPRKLLINWCRISSINSITCFAPVLSMVQRLILETQTLKPWSLRQDEIVRDYECLGPVDSIFQKVTVPFTCDDFFEMPGNFTLSSQCHIGNEV